MKPQLGVSALAWTAEEETASLKLISDLGIRFVELIPARAAKNPDTTLQQLHKLNLKPTAFQALLFGTENLHLFQTEDQREALFDHLSGLCQLAQKLGVRALVFGSPKNRDIDLNVLDKKTADKIAKEFFKDLGEIALQNKTTICLEPNPAAYGTNFLNGTVETSNFVSELNHLGVRLNLDLGAVEMNEEDLSAIWPKISSTIGHIHWSAPQLKPVSENSPKTLQTLLHCLGNAAPSSYDGLVSIEMRLDPKAGIQSLEKTLRSAQKTFEAGA